ncbi:MAG TPA: hypothetical protein VJV04_02165, partial [Nitrospiraceae bacterium]|nr:hypothetical protein [Nitrospiraceae bacterium]
MAKEKRAKTPRAKKRPGDDYTMMPASEPFPLAEAPDKIDLTKLADPPKEEPKPEPVPEPKPEDNGKP